MPPRYLSMLVIAHLIQQDSHHMCNLEGYGSTLYLFYILLINDILVLPDNVTKQEGVHSPLCFLHEHLSVL